MTSISPMALDDLLRDPAPAWQRWVGLLALPVSIGLHFLVADLVFNRPLPQAMAEQWIEMAVVEAPPPPPPEPEVLETKPPPPQPRARQPVPIDFKETVPEAPTPEEQRPRPRRAVRQIQGLSARSFAQGSGTGLQVRAGTTTGVAASDELMDLDEATSFSPLPVSTVTTQPRHCTRPPVQVPQEAIDAEYEGTIRMTLDLDIQGHVTSVAFLERAGFGVEQACRAAALQIRCKPAQQNGQPVPVTGMPHRCTIKAID